MKKIIALLLVLVFGVMTLTGCAGVVDKVVDAIPDSIVEKLPDSIKDLIGIEDIVEQVTIDAAVKILEELYGNKEGEKIPETENDFEIVAKVVIEQVNEFTITWTCDDERIQIKDSATAGYVIVDLPTENATAKVYTLTATITGAAGATGTFSFQRTLPSFEGKAEVETLLQSGVAYKLYINQVTANKHLFATSNIDAKDNRYIEAIEDYTAAADFFAEANGDGYKFYTMIGGAKKYLNARVEPKAEGTGTVRYLSFEDSTNSVWVYNPETLGWYVTIDSEGYVMGTYSNYETVSLSESRHLTAENTGKSQFPAQFITAEKAEELAPKGEQETIEMPDLNNKFTISANNSKETLYFDGTFNSKDNIPARMNGVTDISKAVAVTVSPVEGGYVISYKVNGVVNYIVFDTVNAATKAAAGKLTTNVAEATVFVWNELLGTFEAADSHRAFATDPATEFTTFSTYATSNGATYDWGEFKVAGANISDNVVVEETPAAPAVPENVVTSAPAAGDYYIGVVYPDENAYHYLTGAIGNAEYRQAIDTLDKAAVYTLEVVDGGYNVKVGNKYLNIVKNGTYTNALLQDAPAGVWVWNDTLKTIAVTVEGTEFVLMNTNYPNVEAKKTTTTGATIAQLFTASAGGNTPVEPGVPTTEATIDLKGTTNLTGKTTEQLVYTQNGITVTNDKDASTNDVFQNQTTYAARFYKSSKVTIAANGMTKIVFNCESYQSNPYAEELVNSLANAGYTATRDNLVVTLVLDAATNSITFSCTAQIRINTIDVTTGAAPVDPPVDPETPVDPPVNPPVDPETPADPATSTTVSKTHKDIASIAGVTAGQNTGVIAGKSIALDDVITIVAAKGAGGTDPCIYDFSLRLYQNGNTLTITAKDGYKIESVVLSIDTVAAAKGPITVAGGVSSELTNLQYVITANADTDEIVVTTAGTDKNNRCYITNIAVTYVAE